MSVVSFDFKKWRKESLIVTLFSVFMCCVFAPLEFYHGNYLNFWFTMDYIVGFIIVLALSLILITLVLFSINIKGKPYLGAVFWGLMVAMYIQGNFMLKSYGDLDGHDIDWNVDYIYAFINSVIWILIPVMVCVCIFFYEQIIKIVVKFVSIGIISVQLITLIVSWLINPVQIVGKEEYAYTTDGIFDYSSEENIVLFVADTFAGELFEELIDEDNSLVDYFDGFTWYNDFSGSYQFTDDALNFLFNPDWDYSNVHNNDRHVFWKQGSFFDRLNKEAGYSVGFYSTMLGYTSTDNTQLFTNLKPIECDNRFKLGRDYYRMLAFRYMPHVLKKHFVVNESVFESHRRVKDNSELYSYANEDFMYYLNNIDITNDEKEKRFELIHIRGAHYPYTLTSELQTVGDNETDVLNQSISTIKIFGQYLDKMKEKGTYENTTIFFMGDHGIHNYAESQPVLLIKPAQAYGNMEIDSTPASAEQFVDTIYNLVGIDVKDKKGKKGIIGDNIYVDGITRKYRFYDIDSDSSSIDWIEYDVYPGLFMKKNSNNQNNNTTDDNHNLINNGVSLDAGDIFEYSQVGFGAEGDVLPSASLVFPTTIYNSAVLMKIDAEAVSGYKYQFFVSNELVGEYTCEQFGDNGIVVEVPAELIDNGVINLRIKTRGHIITGDELATSENPSGRGKFLKIKRVKFLTQ